MPLDQEYCELIALTKLYLLQEYQGGDWKYSEEESYAYFKELAKRSSPPIEKKAPPVAAPPVETKAPPPIETKAPPVVAPPVETKAPPVETKAPPHIEAKAPPPVEIKTPPIETKAPPPAEKKAVAIVEPVKPVETVDFSDIQKILQARFPALALLPHPPDDREARLGKKTTAAEVVILSFDKQTPLFLKNMAIAIQQELGSAAVVSAQRIESEKGWEKLLRENPPKLIISTDYGLYTLQEAMQFYREVPKQAKYFLGNIPLLLLTDLSLYIKEPKLKPTLWRAICQIMQ